MSSPTPPAKNGFIRFIRKIRSVLGFQKTYNLCMYVVFGGALLGFALARLEFFSFNGVFCNAQASGAAQGECYWYQMQTYHAGILLHLAGMLPGGILAVFQFMPAIRHRAILYHRIAGHLIILLAILGIIGALIIVRIAFGGELVTQAVMGLNAIGSIIALGLAYYNIKRKQIDQHRAWMLRAWFWMSSIISLRFIQIIAAEIISMYPTGYYTVQPCAKLATILDEPTLFAQYPNCDPSRINGTVDSQVVVKANMSNSVDTAMSALDMSFGTAAVLALIIHAVGVEIYLRLTSREAERLRNISHQRQRELGMKDPGSAGLVAERFGDMKPWLPLEADSIQVQEVRVGEEHK